MNISRDSYRNLCEIDITAPHILRNSDFLEACAPLHDSRPICIKKGFTPSHPKLQYLLDPIPIPDTVLHAIFSSLYLNHILDLNYDLFLIFSSFLYYAPEVHDDIIHFTFLGDKGGAQPSYKVYVKSDMTVYDLHWKFKSWGLMCNLYLDNYVVSFLFLFSKVKSSLQIKIDVKTQRKIVSYFVGKKVHFYFLPPPPPSDPFFVFFWQKTFFSDFLKKFQNIFSMKLTVKTFRIFFAMNSVVKIFLIA